LVGRFANPAVRRSFALTAAAATLGLAFSLYLATDVRFSVPWMASLGASFSLQATEQNSVFVLWVAALSLLAVLAGAEDEARAPTEAGLRSLFAMEASLMGVFLASDVLLLACFLGCATASVIVSLSDGRRPNVVVLGYVAAFMACLGVLSGGFQMVRAQTGFASTSPNHWASVVLYPEYQPTIVVVVLAVAVVWLALFPFSVSIRRRLELGRGPSCLLFVAGFGLLPAYILSTRIAPALSLGVTALAPLGLALGAVSIAYAVATSKTSLVTPVAGYHGVFVVLWSTAQPGGLAANLWILHSSICLASLAVLNLGRAHGSADLERRDQERRAKTKAVSVLVSWVAMGAPGTLGFAAIRLAVAEANDGFRSSTALAALLGFVLVAYAILRARGTVLRAMSSLPTSRMRLLLALLSISFAVGLASGSWAPRPSATRRDTASASARLRDAPENGRIAETSGTLRLARSVGEGER
jgi:hypothetical protein